MRYIKVNMKYFVIFAVIFLSQPSLAQNSEACSIVEEQVIQICEILRGDAVDKRYAADYLVITTIAPDEEENEDDLYRRPAYCPCPDVEATPCDEANKPRCAELFGKSVIAFRNFKGVSVINSECEVGCSSVTDGQVEQFNQCVRLCKAGQ